MSDTRPRFTFASVALVQAYVANNRLAASDVPRLVALVHGALLALADGSTSRSAVPDVPRPDAEAIRRSVGPDGIISFINGRTYSTLKQHLTANGLDPTAYRARYGLPADYPMVAAAYSERRSRLAKGGAIDVGRGAVAEGGGRAVAKPPGRRAKELQLA